MTVAQGFDDESEAPETRAGGTMAPIRAIWPKWFTILSRAHP